MPLTTATDDLTQKEDSVSIIIPNFNGKALLAKNLPSVLHAASSYSGNCEIIVVDDGSRDDSCAHLHEKYKQVKVVVLRENKGFSHACNSGSMQSTANIILLLNNDVKVNENFLAPLTHCLLQQDDTFAVTPQILSEAKNSGMIQAEFRRGFIRDIHRDVNIQNADGTKIFPTLYACGAALMCRKKHYVALGGLDEIFSPYYYEDFDLGYRAWKRGWRTLHAPGSIVYHMGHQTLIKDDRRKFFYDRNRLIFHWQNLTDKDLLARHFSCLTLKLIGFTLSMRRRYLKSFFNAMQLLPAIREKRKNEMPFIKYGDKDIMKIVNSEG